MRHATAPPRGLRLAYRNSASRPTGPPLRHHVPRRRLHRHPHLLRHKRPPGGGSTSPLPFPFGMRNAAAHASSTSANFTKYEDLPGHHLLSIHSLIASSPDESYPETATSIANDFNFFMNNFTAKEAVTPRF